MPIHTDMPGQNICTFRNKHVGLKFIVQAPWRNYIIIKYSRFEKKNKETSAVNYKDNLMQKECPWKSMSTEDPREKNWVGILEICSHQYPAIDELFQTIILFKKEKGREKKKSLSEIQASPLRFHLKNRCSDVIGFVFPCWRADFGFN